MPRDENPRDDGGANDGAVDDGGAGKDAAPPMTTGGSGGAPFTLPPIQIPEGGWCALSVGAQCDGREDCPDGERCCALFNPTTVTYDSIGCSSNCRGPTNFEVCHADRDDEPDCLEPGLVCRPSLIATFDFITVCALPLGVEVPTNNSTALPGLIACGRDQSCEVGLEQCCLRARYQLGQSRPRFLEPYCAPLEAGDGACDCDDEPPSTGGPQDAGMDASAGDASMPDPGDDDAG